MVSLSQLQALLQGHKIIAVDTILAGLHLPCTEDVVKEVVELLKPHYVMAPPYIIGDPQWWATYITEVLYYSVSHQSGNCVACAVYHRLRLPGCPATRTVDPKIAHALVNASFPDERARILYQQGLASRSVLQAMLRNYSNLASEDAGWSVLHALGVAISVCDVNGASSFLPALIAETDFDEIVLPDGSVRLIVDDVSGWDWFIAMLQSTNYVYGTPEERALQGERIITSPTLFYAQYVVSGMRVALHQQAPAPLDITISHCYSSYGSIRSLGSGRSELALMLERPLGNVIPSIEGASRQLQRTPTVSWWTPTCNECAATTPTWDQLVRKQYHCARK